MKTYQWHNEKSNGRYEASQWSTSFVIVGILDDMILSQRVYTSEDEIRDAMADIAPIDEWEEIVPQS